MTTRKPDGLPEYAICVERSPEGGSIFTGDDHARLAYLIWRRWAMDHDAALVAWQRLFQNTAVMSTAFLRLLERGRVLASKEDKLKSLLAALIEAEDK